MSFWTDERVATLKRLHAEGLTYASIALRMGTTRNACVGLVKRHKLPERAVSKAMVRHHAKFREPEPLIAPGSVPVTLMQLGFFHCRWPIGKVKGPETLFCGSPKYGEKSYCHWHCGIAWSRAA